MELKLIYVSTRLRFVKIIQKKVFVLIGINVSLPMVQKSYLKLLLRIKDLLIELKSVNRSGNLVVAVMDLDVNFFIMKI
jgi:hypothetical protein